jgi:hypothetical protein
MNDQTNQQDVYNTPLPQGATVGQTDYDTPLPTGASIGQPSETGLQKFTQGVEGQNEDNPAWQSPITGGMISGAVKSAANAAGTVVDMLTNKGKQFVPPGGMKILATEYKAIHPDATPEQVSDVLNKVANGKTPFSKETQEAASWLHSSGQPNGFWEQVGSIGEQMMEWMGGEGILKLASAPVKAAEAGEAAVQAVDTVGHVAQAQQVSKVLSANNKLAGIVALGLKAAQEALTKAVPAGLAVGTQNYLHNEDVGSAEKAGLLGGVISAPLHAAQAGLEGLVGEFEKIAPKQIEENPVIAAHQEPVQDTDKSVNVANTEIPVAATHPENVENLSPVGEAVKGYSTKQGAKNFVAEQVQPSAQKALQGNFSQSAVDSVNGLRALRNEDPYEEGQPVLKTTAGIAKFMKGEAQKTYQTLDDAAQHDIDEWTNKYGKAAQKEEAKEGVKDFASKLDEYGKPSTEGVNNGPKVTDIPPKPKLFTELQDQINDAKDTIKSKGSSQVDKQTAIENLPKYEQEMKNFMKAHPDLVDDQELSEANKVYAEGTRYDWIAKQLRSATKGAQAGGKFSGDTIQIRPQALENMEGQYDNKFGEGAFKKLLGAKAYNNYNTVVNTLKTPETGSKFVEWLNNLPLHAGKILTIPAGSFADRLLFDPEIADQIIDKFKGASELAAKTGKWAPRVAGTTVKPNPLQQALQGTASSLQ